MPLTLTVINDAASRLGADTSCCWRGRGGTLGRGENNDWTLPDPAMEISRCHARIRYDDGEYFLEDTSANGVLLADGVTRMDPAQPYQLRDGDELVVGDYRLRVTIEPEQRMTTDAGGTLASPEIAEPGRVDDPLELLGGAPEERKQRPAEPRHAPSYLDEHFSPPRFSNPDPARDSPSASRDRGTNADVKLPEDWWREAPGLAVPETPDPAEGQAASMPPGVAAEESGEPPSTARPGESTGEPEQEPETVQRPTPGGRGSRQSRVAPADGQAEPAGGDAPGIPDQALRQLLAGAGLDPDQVPPEKAEELGRILRVAVRGVMDLLRARMEIKNEFRMPVTLIQASENNPLKFSTSTEDALHNLMVKNNPEYLPPVEAFEASFEDLRHHQIALLAGMRAAFFEMLRQFHPHQLEQRFGDKGEQSVLERVTGPRYWEQYKALFAEIDCDTEGYFNRFFGEAFVAAYEQQMQELKAGSRRGGG